MTGGEGGPHGWRHRPPRSAGRAVRLRDELPADGGASNRAGVGPRSRDSGSGDDRHHRPRIPVDQRPRAAAVSDEQHDALQRLERRVEVLEQMVRRLVAAGAAPQRIPPPPAPLPLHATPARPPEQPRYSPPPTAAPDLEQWFGQRGLLIVGVLALLTAAGPYGLLEHRIGVLLLAACTVVVTLLALRHEIEGLAIWALAGAYLAPLLLPPHTPNPEAFLGYLEVIGLGTGLLAYTMTWRSEEHTSELQSPCNLVCRLLLEKKKKTRKNSMEQKRTKTNLNRC